MKKHGIFIYLIMVCFISSLSAQNMVEKRIPLNISVLYDYNNQYTADKIPEDFLIAKNPHFNPGFYDGVIWMDITFPNTQKSFGSSYELYFGPHPINYAEAFVYDNEKWIPIGITGHGISKENLTTMSWRRIISINETEFHDQKTIHIRVKLINSLGSSLQLSIVPKEAFKNETLFLTTTHIFIAFLCTFIIFFMFCFGISIKDKIHITLSLGALFLLLFQLQKKGIGPVYLWNFITIFKSSYKISYFLGLLLILFLSITFLLLIEECNPALKSKKIMISVIIVSGIEFFLTAAISSEEIINWIYSIELITICIFFMVLTITNLRRTHEYKYILIFWVPAMILTTIERLFSTLRCYIDFPLFHIFDFDNFYTIDICFFLLTVPSLFITSKKIHNIEIGIRKENKEYQNKINQLEDEISTVLEITKNIINSNNMIHNLANLPEFTNLDSAQKKSISLIDRSAVKTVDMTYALTLLFTKEKPHETSIQLLNFINSCMDSLNHYYHIREQHLSVTTAIANDTVVICNENILETLTLNFFNITSNACPKNARLDVLLNYRENIFSIDIQCKMNTQEIHDGDAIFNNSNGFIKKVSSFYNGKINNKLANGIMNFHFELTIHQSTDITGLKRNSVIFQMETENPVIPNKKFIKNNGKVAKIVFIENDSLFAGFIDSMLSPIYDIEIFSTSTEAIEYLESSDDVDLVFIEYDTPDFSALEFLKNCRDDNKFMDIPFAIFLETKDLEALDKIVDTQAIMCIQKPVNLNKLYIAVDKLITLSEMAKGQIINRVSKVLTSDIQISSGAIDYPEGLTAVQATNYSITQSIFQAAKLSSREKEIAELIVQGKSDKEIADILNISPQTVASHNKNIFRKLEIHSRVELINKVR